MPAKKKTAPVKLTANPRGSARVSKKPPLTPAQLKQIDAYWRASNYLTACQIYLLDNPLLERPLTAAGCSGDSGAENTGTGYSAGESGSLEFHHGGPPHRSSDHHGQKTLRELLQQGQSVLFLLPDVLSRGSSGVGGGP